MKRFLIILSLLAVLSANKPIPIKPEEKEKILFCRKSFYYTEYLNCCYAINKDNCLYGGDTNNPTWFVIDKDTSLSYIELDLSEEI